MRTSLCLDDVINTMLYRICVTTNEVGVFRCADFGWRTFLFLEGGVLWAKNTD